MKVSPSLRKLPLSMASMIAFSALAPAVAQAAGPIPNFQLPLPCGQTWRASTYTQHWNGDQDALDFAQRDGNQGNLSRGEYALAAAAGEVDLVHTVGGEHRVYVDHGGGWRTAYIHLKELPPLAVGQRVAQGEVIGLVSNSGTDGTNDEHLHYNQFRDGTTIRATFNDQLVDTHAGDMSVVGALGLGERRGDHQRQTASTIASPPSPRTASATRSSTSPPPARPRSWRWSPTAPP